MFDAIDNSQFPPGGGAYASYVDGHLGDQPNYNWTVRAFPGARHLSIALFPEDDADAIDVEAGAAGTADIPGWYARQVARGIARPVVYASAYTMDAGVLPVLSAAGIARASVRLWTAHYDIGEHICGPASCEALRIAADGTQWTSNALGRDLDQSLLLEDFFGTPAPPTTVKTPPATVNWTENLVQQLPTLQQGATGTFVRTVQFQCGERGHAVKVDGSYGPLTVAAVKAAQAAAKVAQDGVTGPVTWGILLGV
jgi:hypothetical protein